MYCCGSICVEAVKTREFTNYACDIVVSEQHKRKCSNFAIQVRSQMMPKGCLLCGSNHYLNHCTKFRKLSFEERCLFVKEKRLWNLVIGRITMLEQTPAKNWVALDGTQHYCIPLHREIVTKSMHLSTKKERNENRELQSAFIFAVLTSNVLFLCQ